MLGTYTHLHLALATFLSLLLVTLSVWSVVYAQGASGQLAVPFLDVGQGDAIFIEAPNGKQVLIDAGKGQAVLGGLAEVMSFGDRHIDVAIATHPDLDHIGGFPEVFARYAIDQVVISGVEDSGADAAALAKAMDEEGVVPIVARAGQLIALDEGVYLEILFPDRPLPTVEANTGSIVARLVYGSTSFLLTGDAPGSIEQYLVEHIPELLPSTVLKLGHHGSRTSTTEDFLAVVNPSFAIVSAGCDNSYGHPHAEVLKKVEDEGAVLLSTCTHGTILLTSDGTSVVERE